MTTNFSDLKSAVVALSLNGRSLTNTAKNLADTLVVPDAERRVQALISLMQSKGVIIQEADDTLNIWKDRPHVIAATQFGKGLEKWKHPIIYLRNTTHTQPSARFYFLLHEVAHVLNDHGEMTEEEMKMVFLANLFGEISDFESKNELEAELTVLKVFQGLGLPTALPVTYLAIKNKRAEGQLFSLWNAELDQKTDLISQTVLEILK